MPLAMRHRRDVIAPQPALTGLVVRRECDPAAMSMLQGRSVAEMAARFAESHHAYMAYLHDEPAAWGWVATKRAMIGELGTTFEIPQNQRYLWNFVTLPAHRGKGLLAAQLLGVAQSDAPLSQCWRCVRADASNASCRTTTCCCDYQKPQLACAAPVTERQP